MNGYIQLALPTGHKSEYINPFLAKETYDNKIISQKWKIIFKEST